MYAKLVNLITVFSKTGERCQNNTDVSANVKGMNYFFVALYAKSILVTKNPFVIFILV